MAGITVTTASKADVLVDNRGYFPDLITLLITGMTQGATNAVPHGLPRTPKRVWFTGLASGANVADCSLDSATAAAGFDGTYIYIFTPSGITQVLAHVEY
jgi:hypothetical protein